MFRSDFNTYYKGIRETSDELCRENRLSVIETDGKGKSYDEWLSGQAGKPTIRGMVRKDVEQAIAAADSFDGLITELQNMGYGQKYGSRVWLWLRAIKTPENIALTGSTRAFRDSALRSDATTNCRMPHRKCSRNTGRKTPKTEMAAQNCSPTVRRNASISASCRAGIPRCPLYGNCYYHYCALLRKAYHGKSTKRSYFLLREDFLLFSRYQQQTKFPMENHIETMDELLAYKGKCRSPNQQLARQRKVLYRQKREPERAADEKIKS